jgi:phage shock protein A
MAGKIDQLEAEAEAAGELQEEYTGDVLASKFQSLERGAGADEELAALKRKMGMLPPEEAPAVRADTPKRVEAPAATPPAASRNEQDELAAALEEMEAEQNQEQQRKAGR